MSELRFSRFFPVLLPFGLTLALGGCAGSGGEGDDLGTPSTGGEASSTGGTTGSGGGDSLGTGGVLGSGGDAGGTGGTNSVPGTPTLPNGRGATVPYAEYEAEAMVYTGTPLATSRTFGQIASEASGRAGIRLYNQGQYVEFTNQVAANSIVVRYSIPDMGADYWGSLAVYVDGTFRQNITVTSRYSWTYGDDSKFNKPEQNDPGQGYPHHFFDETRALIGDVPAGAVVRIQRDAGSTLDRYDIDLVDMELVPAAIPKPAGAISIADCGATPNDDTDDSSAIQSCIDQAQGSKKVLYIPEGTFQSRSKGFSVSGLTIQGAGMWRSTIEGFFARFDCWGNGCKYYDFAVFGDTTQRIDDSPETAFSGNGSSDSILDRIWVEHSKVGYWTGPGTQNLHIRNSRFRNLFADAVNFYGGTSDSSVENCHARNTGDDAFASWAHNIKSTNKDNAFRHNYVQVPWKANCFGIYGGESTILEDNVCADVVQYPGILLGRQFDGHPFAGMTELTRNTLIRAGGFAYGQGQGALKLHAEQGTLQNITIKDLDVLDATYAAVHIQGPGIIDSVWLTGVNVQKAGSAAFQLGGNAEGALDAVNVVASDVPFGVLDDSGGKFKILRGTGNSGW